jgi:PHD-finger
LLWDCSLAEGAEQNGENLEDFLDLLPTNRVMLMEILHRNRYEVHKARKELIESLGEGLPEALSAFNFEETDKFAKLIMEDFGRYPSSVGLEGKPYFSKRFKHMSKILGRSVNACLGHYYSKFKPCPLYKKLKKKIAKEREDYLSKCEEIRGVYCVICEDGGVLISCDNCYRDFHQSCLDPPLLAVPDGDWFCPDCIRKNPKVEQA